jgi:cobaltochelatase CobN
MTENNPAALRETADRFAEAVERGLWQPRRNSAQAIIEGLRLAPSVDAAG